MLKLTFDLNSKKNLKGVDQLLNALDQIIKLISSDIVADDKVNELSVLISESEPIKKIWSNILWLFLKEDLVVENVLDAILWMKEEQMGLAEKQFIEKILLNSKSSSYNIIKALNIVESLDDSFFLTSLKTKLKSEQSESIKLKIFKLINSIENQKGEI